jgi:hypothetical protein
MFPVMKKPGSVPPVRIILNLEPLNAISIQDAAMITNINEFAESFVGYSMYGLADLFSGFDAIWIHPKSLYDTIIFEALPEDDLEVEMSKRVLYAVVTTRRPLTISNLAPLVVDGTEDADEEAVRNTLNLFHAVLYVSSRDKCIYTFHKSFADFILDSPELAAAARSYFPDRTRNCFHIMNESLRFNICNLTSSFLLDSEEEGLSQRFETRISPELRYACQHWAAYLSSVRHKFQGEVQQLSALLFDFCGLKILFWMEAMNLLKRDCRVALHLARTWALEVRNYGNILDCVLT